MPRSLDVGVTAAQISDLLAVSPTVSIVGYQRSGKSTFAEMLHRDLRGEGRTVFMQTASLWSPHAVSAGGGDRAAASVDAEIVNIMEKLDAAPGQSCWIVDDAEVMFAYATNRVLESLGARLQRGRSALVLIRNRFVMEGEGWFHQRQSVIASDMPTVRMTPMPGNSAVRVATAMFDGAARAEQGRWLASMSGGIPGLMLDLLPYTPPWPPADPDELLLDFAARKRAELELDRPMRRLLIEALSAQMLPPPSLLSDQARRELGALLLAGMVSTDYVVGGERFNGDFWDLVCGTMAKSARVIPPRLQDAALAFEALVRRTELTGVVEEACGVPGGGAGTLALAIAASLACEEQFPTLIRPVRPLLVEVLGRYGLLQMARAGEVPMPAGAPSSAELIEALLDGRP